MSPRLRFASPVLGSLVRDLRPTLRGELRARLLSRADMLAAEAMDRDREGARTARCRRWLVESWLPCLLRGVGLEDVAHRLCLREEPARHLRAVRNALVREVDAHMRHEPQSLFDGLLREGQQAEPFGSAALYVVNVFSSGLLVWGGEVGSLGSAAKALALYRYGALPRETRQDLRLSALYLLEDVAAITRAPREVAP